MVSQKDIPDFLHSNSMIYHYTKRNTALNKILENSQLKFSQRQNTNDPFEHSIFNVDARTDSYWIFGKPKNIFTLPPKEVIKLGNELFDTINKKSQQLSFCSNNQQYSKDKIDCFGFLKPRMWAQYGENFKGICLGYDRDILVSELNNQFPGIIYSNDVQYFSFEKFYGSSNIFVDAYSCEEKDYGQYYNMRLSDCIEKIFMRKHVDYGHENEFRIVKVDEEYNGLFHFKKSLRCIIFNEAYFMKTKFEELSKFSEIYDVPLVCVNWRANDVQTYVIR